MSFCHTGFCLNLKTIIGLKRKSKKFYGQPFLLFYDFCLDLVLRGYEKIKSSKEKKLVKLIFSNFVKYLHSWVQLIVHFSWLKSNPNGKKLKLNPLSIAFCSHPLIPVVPVIMLLWMPVNEWHLWQVASYITENFDTVA